MNANSEKANELDNIVNNTSDSASEQKVLLTNTIVIDIEKLVSETSELISLPEIYMKIRELMNSPNSTLADFSVVVNTDPALMVSVLKIVNSAFYGFTGKIDNLKRALVLIGIGQLHDLVLSLSAFGSLNLPNDIENLTKFWQRSIYCGVLSRLIAEKLVLEEKESLFVIGLLHEIGRLILFVKYPKESRQAINYAQTENLSLTEVERMAFGSDYSQIGQALMSKWNLPLKFQIIIGNHTEPEKTGEYLSETAIVHLAHMIAANTFPGADNYQFTVDQDILASLKINEEEIDTLCAEANIISLEMRKLILGAEG